MTSKSTDTAMTSENHIASANLPAGQPLKPVFHPNMLLVRWEIAVRASDWLSASTIAKALILALPDEPIGWIYQAFAQQQMGLLPQAQHTLLTAAKKFPSDWRIAYNLACYTAQLGDVAGAWNCLERAFEVGDPTVIKPLAAKEPSLKPLWKSSLARRAENESSFAA